MKVDPPVAGRAPDRDGFPALSAPGIFSHLLRGAVVAPLFAAADHLMASRHSDPPPTTGTLTTTRSVSLRGGARVRVHVTRPGCSTAFVLTHGLGCDHRLWDNYIDGLAASGTVVSWDMPGHGVSPPPEDPDAALQPAALAAALCAVVEAVTAPSTRVVVMGHSLGGLISLLALRDHDRLRARVDAAVLIATPLTDLGQAMAQGGRFGGMRAAGIRAGVTWALGSRVAHELFGHPVTAVTSYGLVRNMGFGPRPQAGQVRHLRQVLTATPARIRQATMAATFGIDVRGTLSHIAVPALVVVGDYDRLVPARHSCEMLDELPHSSLLRFPRAGHAVVLEHVEDIIAHTGRFLDAVTAADAG